MQDREAVTGRWEQINWLSGAQVVSREDSGATEVAVECQMAEGSLVLRFVRLADHKSVSGDRLDTGLTYRRPFR